MQRVSMAIYYNSSGGNCIFSIANVRKRKANELYDYGVSVKINEVKKTSLFTWIHSVCLSYH